MDKLGHLQKALGYRFSDCNLLELALSHRSVGGRNNERLEFLGDSLVNHIVAEELFRRFPEAREGQMSRMRASLVKGETLARLATELGIGECLRLGPGEVVTVAIQFSPTPSRPWRVRCSSIAISTIAAVASGPCLPPAWMP